MHLVQVLVEENRHLKQWPGREPGHANPAVPLQPEERAQALLAAAWGSELDQEVRDGWPDVPEAVRRGRLYDDDVAGPDRSLLKSDPEAQRPRDPLESLPLAPVDMHGDEAAGPDEQFSGDTIGRPLAEDDGLPRHGVRDDVYAVADHLI